MKCSKSLIISRIHVKVMFINKCLAKIQMSVSCCNMKTGLSNFSLEKNIRSYISKKLNYFVDTILCRTMKRRISLIINHIDMKFMFLNKCLAKIQMSVGCCNMKAVLSIICFKVNIDPHIFQTFNVFMTIIFCRMIELGPSVIITHIEANVFLLNKFWSCLSVHRSFYSSKHLFKSEQFV